MTVEDFHYNNFWLSDYGMKMCKPEESQQFIGREFDRAEFSSIRSIPNHYSAHYTDALLLSFLIIKDVCLYQNKNLKLSGSDINNLRSWLESPRRPSPLFVLPYDESEVYYFGIFTNIQPFVVGNECYGLYLTFTCNAPFGFSSLVTNTYEINSYVGNIENIFFNASAEQYNYLNPTIKIFSDSTFTGEKLIIRNMSDEGNFMELTLPSGTSSITVDCKNKCVLDENGILIPINDIGMSLQNSELNYVQAEQYVFYWLRLIYRNNKLIFSMPTPNTISKIEISTRYIIKSGGF